LIQGIKMKIIRLTWAILVTLCAVLGLGCGDDNGNAVDGNGTTMVDTDNRGDQVNIVGTWKLVSIEPPVGDVDLPDTTFTINADGTWNGTSVSQIPVFGKLTVTSKGTYKISGNKVTSQTTEVKIEPDFGVQPPASSEFAKGEVTVERDENKLIITSKDETTGQTTTTVYETISS